MRIDFNFDSNDIGGIVGIAPCMGLLVGSYGLESNGNTWTTAVLTIVYDAGGGRWEAYPSVATLVTATRNSARLDLTWFDRVALKITTAEGSSQRLFGTFFGKERE